MFNVCVAMGDKLDLLWSFMSFFLLITLQQGSKLNLIIFVGVRIFCELFPELVELHHERKKVGKLCMYLCCSIDHFV